jgi:hypothetical protein
MPDNMSRAANARTFQSPLRQTYSKKATAILSNKCKEEYNILGSDAVQSGRILPTSKKHVLSIFRVEEKAKQRFSSRSVCALLFVCLAYSFIRKMNELRFS